MKSLMKKPAGKLTANLKRPASKKDAARKQKHDERETVKTGSLQIMVYKKTKSVAVRVRQGRQLFAVSKFHNVDQNRNAAAKLMKMLEKGANLGKVLVAKANLS